LPVDTGRLNGDPVRANGGPDGRAAYTPDELKALHRLAGNALKIAVE